MTLWRLFAGSRNAQVIALVIALGMAAIGFRIWLGGERKAARQEGITIERTDSMGRVLINVEKANEARREVGNPASRAAYDECVRSARNPENCERLLPAGSGD